MDQNIFFFKGMSLELFQPAGEKKKIFISIKCILKNYIVESMLKYTAFQQSNRLYLM